MMWFVLAGMGGIAILAVTWPLLRSPSSSAPTDAALSAAAFYKRQLDEIQRDLERGHLPPVEAENARAEAARRLIAASSDGGRRPSPPRLRDRILAAASVALGAPAIAFTLYAVLGQPRMRDEPLASRKPESEAAGAVEAAVAAVEARLIAKPDDGKGWAIIAPVYMRLERYYDAVHAYSEALRLLGEDGRRRAAYGEALIAAAGGVVTDKARESFDQALADEPGQPQARFYLALGAEQDGKTTEAISAYEALIADSPPDAPWVALVRARVASARGETPPGSAVSATRGAAGDSQQAMIEGMVRRLATRLASNGGSVDDWSRLIRAYSVLHQADKAKMALADARRAVGPDASAAASLDALARDLGIGDAN